MPVQEERVTGYLEYEYAKINALLEREKVHTPFVLQTKNHGHLVSSQNHKKDIFDIKFNS